MVILLIFRSDKYQIFEPAGAGRRVLRYVIRLRKNYAKTEWAKMMKKSSANAVRVQDGEELEEFHDLAVGCELKMKRMKEEMEGLKKKLEEKEK